MPLHGGSYPVNSHLCGNRACLNPEHIVLEPMGTNLLRVRCPGWVLTDTGWFCACNRSIAAGEEGSLGQDHRRRGRTMHYHRAGFNNSQHDCRRWGFNLPEIYFN